jgi:predicted O-linked N-acetylglucosamine transferase (SPINDLY family)
MHGLKFVTEPWEGRRLRIGIMTGDFGPNSVGRELMALVLALSRDSSWVACVSLGYMGQASAGEGSRGGRGGGGGEVAYRKMEEVCRAKGSWVDLGGGGGGGRGGGGRSLEESVMLLNAQRLHVLIDVQGWGRGHALSLIRKRPAPVQVYLKTFVGTLIKICFNNNYIITLL